MSNNTDINTSKGQDQIRVVTYARVSTQEQAAEGTSMEFQESQLSAYCQLQGWIIMNSYVDPGYSGKDDKRPGLQRLLSDAKLGMFEKVVVCKLDRMARNLHLMLDIEAKLRESRVSLTSIKESVDTSTGTGKLIFSMFSMIAEWERETIIERTRSGRLQRYREGCWAGGKPLFGYYRDAQTKRLAINEDEARLVRRIYKEYNLGKSLNAIANVLNAEHVATRLKGGKGWVANTVRHLLINPGYKGNLIVNRHTNVSNLKKIDPGKTISIPVPPIVSESTWQLAQDRLANNIHVKPKEDGVFILQGLVKCGICHYSYRAERIYGKRYYECRGRLKINHLDGSDRCPSHSIPAEWLESEVWKKMEEILNDPNKLEVALLDTINSLRSREAELRAKRQPIDDRLAEIEAQKKKLADDWIIRNMDSVRFNELRHQLEKEEVRLRTVVAEFDPAQIEELEATRGILRFWEGQLKSVAWNLEDEREGHMVRTMDTAHKTALKVAGFESRELTTIMAFPASRRELLDKFQVKLVVYPDRIEVKASFDVAPISCQNVTSMRGGHRG